MSAATISRRNALRLLGLGAGALAAAPLLATRDASAGRAWCRTDPVISVDGQLADIFIASDPQMLLSATGPIKIKISVPVGSKGRVYLQDAGFLKGYDISFVETSALTRAKGKTPVWIDVYAPAKDASLPVTVTFAPRTLDSSLADILFGMSAAGVANTWIRLDP